MAVNTNMWFETPWKKFAKLVESSSKLLYTIFIKQPSFLYFVIIMIAYTGCFINIKIRGSSKKGAIF